MDASLFTQINTSISVRESSFIRQEQYQQILQAKDNEALALIIMGTPYHLDELALEDLNAIERALMKHLCQEYAWAFENSPRSQIVEAYSLKYTYHNLKVLLKGEASQKNLENLLIPIGGHSYSQLEHLVATMTAEHCSDFMQGEVLETWQEYLDYQDLRVLEIGMDMAYFRHLYLLANEVAEPVLQQLVGLFIDFYNLITVERAYKQGKPRSFMHQLLSDQGSLEATELIDLVKTGQVADWFATINPCPYDLDLRSYEEKMRQGLLTVSELEYLADLLQWKVLEQAKYQVDGALPLIRYLQGKEFEVKNLRLLLTAHANHLPTELVKERMRPIYG